MAEGGFSRTPKPCCQTNRSLNANENSGGGCVTVNSKQRKFNGAADCHSSAVDERSEASNTESRNLEFGEADFSQNHNSVCCCTRPVPIVDCHCSHFHCNHERDMAGDVITACPHSDLLLSGVSHHSCCAAETYDGELVVKKQNGLPENVENGHRSQSPSTVMLQNLLPGCLGSSCDSFGTFEQSSVVCTTELYCRGGLPMHGVESDVCLEDYIDTDMHLSPAAGSLSASSSSLSDDDVLNLESTQRGDDFRGRLSAKESSCLQSSVCCSQNATSSASCVSQCDSSDIHSQHNALNAFDETNCGRLEPNSDGFVQSSGRPSTSSFDSLPASLPSPQGAFCDDDVLLLQNQQDFHDVTLPHSASHSSGDLGSQNLYSIRSGLQPCHQLGANCCSLPDCGKSTVDVCSSEDANKNNSSVLSNGVSHLNRTHTGNPTKLLHTNGRSDSADISSQVQTNSEYVDVRRWTSFDEILTCKGGDEDHRSGEPSIEGLNITAQKSFETCTKCISSSGLHTSLKFSDSNGTASLIGGTLDRNSNHCHGVSSNGRLSPQHLAMRLSNSLTL